MLSLDAKGKVITLDAKPTTKGNPFSVSTAETRYARALRSVGRQIGSYVSGFDWDVPGGLPKLDDILSKYAETLNEWAIAKAWGMLTSVEEKNKASWRKLSRDMGKSLAAEIESAPTGDRMRQLLNEQVTLIKSIPLDAAQRVHDWTTKGLTEGMRHSDVVAAIMESGNVSVNRATLIARTEVSRASSVLTQARAEYVGSTHFIWRTAQDGDVRSEHKALSGKLFAWNDPPIADAHSGTRALPGCIWNCRCYAEPQINDD